MSEEVETLDDSRKNQFVVSQFADWGPIYKEVYSAT